MNSAADQNSCILSIIIPVYNERGNITELITQLEDSLIDIDGRYELIFVDDHSPDGTRAFLCQYYTTARIIILSKEGERGKSLSLMQGFAASHGKYVGFIDGDLQYPPTAILPLLNLLQENDIAIANRSQRVTGKIRTLLSHSFNYLIGSLLLGLPYDVQSGLKIFRRTAFVALPNKTSPWGFDYTFLFNATRRNMRIAQHDIQFAERTYGTSSIQGTRAGMELALGAIRLRFKTWGDDHKLTSPRWMPHFDNHKDFLFLPDSESTKRQIYPATISLTVLITLTAIMVALGIHQWLGISIPLTISAAIAAFYFGLMVFKLVVVQVALSYQPIDFTPAQIAAIPINDLPIYTIIIPLVNEAEVIPQIISAMTAIDYPVEKLDITITLEAYDHDTINAIKVANPPPYFKTLILPDVTPKTKPKALNVAFLKARGELVVIYDAEIIPEPDQLKKAYLAFRKNPNMACLQTRLDHYNRDQSWVTKLFNAEFSFYYDLFLPGLQKMGIPLPLSGHSTHYRHSALEKVGAWDPYNVTEDCDMGMRLYREGYTTGMINSVSLEEATVTPSAWINQRTRWMKGFIQTSIVHLRHPLRFMKEIGGIGPFLGFLVVVPGSVIINILNLFYTILLLVWFITKSPSIQAFFPSAILTISLISFLAGNFIFTYLNLLGSFRRGRHNIVKYSLLSPIYWLMLAYATVRAAIEIVSRPHYWSKTQHGHHLIQPLLPVAPQPYELIA